MRRLIPVSAQFLVYVSGGVLCALIDVGLMKWLLSTGVGPFAAATTGFLAGLVVNYCFHAKVTFKNVTSAATFLRYLCVVAVNYLITLAMVAASLHLLGMPLVGKILSLPVIAVNGYILSKLWIFKPVS
jgi:putative flippase GtrA